MATMMADNSDNVKKYKKMDHVLNNISKRFISLSDTDRKRNNSIVQKIVESLINQMKLKDKLFKEMYQRVFFGGSYYDGLRVFQADEFDLDLLLKLPKALGTTVVTSNVPGHVHVNHKQYEQFKKQEDLFIRYKQLDNLMDKEQNLNTSKVLSWMERVVNLALTEFKQENKAFVFYTSYGPLNVAKVSKCGPAFTLKVRGEVEGKKISLDIDLVPCFVFGKESWPANGFRPNPVNTKRDFFVVPKPLKGQPLLASCINRYWRLSFQEQERVMIDGKPTLKPTIKLLKKMRDTMGHKYISSYYLKTIVLWQLQTRPTDFWDKPLSYVFMNILKEYETLLIDGKIPYFWYKSNNLLKGIKQDTILNTSKKIKYIIADIEKHIDKDPLVIAKYLLSESELKEFTTDIRSIY